VKGREPVDNPAIKSLMASMDTGKGNAPTSLSSRVWLDPFTGGPEYRGRAIGSKDFGSFHAHWVITSLN
jgi:hypothetical protein